MAMLTFKELVALFVVTATTEIAELMMFYGMPKSIGRGLALTVLGMCAFANCTGIGVAFFECTLFGEFSEHDLMIMLFFIIISQMTCGFVGLLLKLAEVVEALEAIVIGGVLFFLILALVGMIKKILNRIRSMQNPPAAGEGHFNIGGAYEDYHVGVGRPIFLRHGSPWGHCRSRPLDHIV